MAFGPGNLGLRGDELDARVLHALEQVGMAEFADRPPHHLSFGQRRRVAVATVLAMNPEVLVLDEPSSNLDPASRRELADIIRSLDVTVLMVTHDLPYALELCERAVILSDGIIAADGPTRDLLADPELMARHRLELPYGFTVPTSATHPLIDAHPLLQRGEQSIGGCVAGRGGRATSPRPGGGATCRRPPAARPRGRRTCRAGPTAHRSSPRR